MPVWAKEWLQSWLTAHIAVLLSPSTVILGWVDFLPLLRVNMPAEKRHDWRSVDEETVWEKSHWEDVSLCCALALSHLEAPNSVTPIWEMGWFRLKPQEARFLQMEADDLIWTVLQQKHDFSGDLMSQGWACVPHLLGRAPAMTAIQGLAPVVNSACPCSLFPPPPLIPLSGTTLFYSCTPSFIY